MKLSLIEAASIAALLVMAAGCGASTTEDGGPQPTTPPVTPEPTPEPTPDPKVEACKAENAALQAGLDKAHAKDTDAVLAVRNPSCGARTLTSGPSKIDAGRLHRIGSVTKTYVAAVVLGLVHDGALALDDKLSKWVTGVPNGDAITIRHLLTHTSGLFNYTNDKTFQKTPFTKKWTPQELVDVATKNPPYFEPGTSWTYSNTNFILLGMIAEKAANAKIGALVRTRVLEKAGLSATFFDGEEPMKGTLAPGLDSLGRDVTTQMDPSWAWAAGAIAATPDDVAKWIEALGSGTFHDPATQKELLTPVKTDQRSIDYGLGVMLFNRSITAGAGPGIGHGGDIPGFHTQAFYFPEKQTTVVAIVDSDAEDPNDVSIEALQVLFRK